MLNLRIFYDAACFLPVFGGLLLSLLLPLNALADVLPEQSLIAERLQQVRQQSFPELKGTSIQIGRFDESDSFFQSWLDPGQLIQGKWIYQIDVNQRFLELDCPVAALDAVLAHELSHTLDYHRGGIGGILAILWQLLWQPAVYERRTDLQAIARGYGPGLILYRQCQYQALTPEQVQGKKLKYYSPEEMTLILDILDLLDAPAKQEQIKLWLQNPPLNLEQISQMPLEPEREVEDLDLSQTML